jgi:hypothetical protein
MKPPHSESCVPPVPHLLVKNTHCCVTLDKSLPLSDPQFHWLCNEAILGWLLCLHWGKVFARLGTEEFYHAGGLASKRSHFPP